MSTSTPEQKNTRPPVVAILGHIDHGKSTLLDYIRKTRVVDSEAGGITQRLSAYEVLHETKEGEKKKITFLDTPGHEAFSRMRSQGLEVADIAILVVSAEDGVKAQTIEAMNAIRSQGTPFVVALTKIDKSGANIERAKSSLIENEIYLEGLGGDVPYVPLSSKTGDGVEDLLDVLLLLSELGELKGNPDADASGFIIEASRDPKKGISATLILKDGTLRSGQFVVAGSAFAPTRIMQDFAGRSITEAMFSSPIQIIGFSEVPETGAHFQTVGSKKEAEAIADEFRRSGKGTVAPEAEDQDTFIVPVVIKADAAGAIDAIKHEIGKIHMEGVRCKIISEGIGTISENDAQSIGFGKQGLIVGFNVKVDSAAEESARRNGIDIGLFDIIYRLAEWLEEKLETRRPKKEGRDETGSAKVLKVFSTNKDKQIIGGKAENGVLKIKDRFSIDRRGEIIGDGVIIGLQQQKAPTKSVESGEFGAEVESKTLIAPGDTLQCFIIVVK